MNKKDDKPALPSVHLNPWQTLRQFTAARIALGRTGASLPTDEVLRFGMAHAQARDAVHQPFHSQELEPELQALGLKTLRVDSAAPDRTTYLCRPDLGRKLSQESRAFLRALPAQDIDLLLVVADGLSSKAVHRQAVPLITALLPHLRALGIKVGPVVLAHQSRVALGDDIAETMKAKAVAILLGERPGLSSPDSLGIYMTWGPHTRRRESERNCISNVRPEGLDYPQAAFKLAWLLEQAFVRRLSGVDLKDESDNATIPDFTSKADNLSGEG